MLSRPFKCGMVLRLDRVEARGSALRLPISTLVVIVADHGDVIEFEFPDAAAMCCASQSDFFDGMTWTAVR